MTLLVCVDDASGMAFNGRRQSRDRAVCLDMVELAAGAPIRMDRRSAKLFEGLGGNVETAEPLAAQEDPGGFCFVELQPAEALAALAERIVLYRWNRRYPADLHFRVPLEGWQQAGVTEFPGSSHEKITREVYIHADQSQ